MHKYDFFDKIVCLCYDKRLAECTIIEELFDRELFPRLFTAGSSDILGVAYDYVDRTDLPHEVRPQAYNYARCVYKIVSQAKAENRRNLFFLEDDAKLTEKFDKVLPLALEEFKEHVGEAWDVLYIGGNHLNGQVKRISKHIIKPSYSLDLHAVVFNNTFFDVILSEGGGCETYTLDGRVGDLQKTGKYKFYAIHPSIVTQKVGYSYNEFKVVNRAENYFL